MYVVVVVDLLPRSPPLIFFVISSCVFVALPGCGAPRNIDLPGIPDPIGPSAHVRRRLAVAANPTTRRSPCLWRGIFQSTAKARRTG